MSHLQMFISQKEFSNRALQHCYNGQPNQSPASQYTPPNQAWSAYPGYGGEMSLPKTADPYSAMGPEMLPYFNSIPPPAPVSTAPTSTSAISSTTSSTPQTQTSLTTLTSPADHWSMNNSAAQFHNGHHFSAFTTANHNQNLNGYGKPYRPWGGAEMASC